MRRFQFWTLLLALVFVGSGCWVFDELSAGEKEMDRYSHKSKAKKQAAASAKTDEAGAPSTTEKWWQSATSLTPREEGSDLVRCSNAGSTSFTRAADCLAAGGTVVD